jgi:hypothetical protein
MGKRAKEHRKRVAARNQRIQQKRKSIENAHRKLIMDLIEKEKKAGLFDNNIPAPSNGPIIEGPIIEGPIIEGPIIEGPIIEGS